jgi:hypothetical protein
VTRIACISDLHEHLVEVLGAQRRVVAAGDASRARAGDHTDLRVLLAR